MIVVWFCCFYRCCGKNCKKIKYLKCSNKMGVFLVILIYYCVPIVNMKHSYFASQGHNLYCCYI